VAISKPTSETKGLGLATAAELVLVLLENPALDVLWKEHFRVTRTTFEQALTRRKDQFIQFPVTREAVQKSIDEFEEKYGMRQIVGAIDDCHIEINAPSRNHEDYFNRKQIFSVNLQAILDSNRNFLHASVGYSVNIHDARVPRLSGIYDQAQSEQILSAPVRDLRGTKNQAFDRW